MKDAYSQCVPEDGIWRFALRNPDQTFQSPSWEGSPSASRPHNALVQSPYSVPGVEDKCEERGTKPGCIVQNAS